MQVGMSDFLQASPSFSFSPWSLCAPAFQWVWIAQLLLGVELEDEENDRSSEVCCIFAYRSTFSTWGTLEAPRGLPVPSWSRRHVYGWWKWSRVIRRSSPGTLQLLVRLVGQKPPDPRQKWASQQKPNSFNSNLIKVEAMLFTLWS